MKAESERSLYLDCSISQIPEMSPCVCCTPLFSFGIIKFTAGGGQAAYPLGEKRFSAQNGNLQIKQKLPAGASFTPD